MWSEYEACRAGIGGCDRLLLRLRFGHTAIAALLLGGYLAFVDPREVGPGTAILALAWIGATLWALDASARAGQAIYWQAASGGAFFGPTLALRFGQARHWRLRDTILHLLDDSVWPFHLAPVLISTAVIGAYNVHEAGCFRRGCDPSWWDFAQAAMGHAPIIAAILLSLAWRSRNPALRYRFDRRRARRHAFREAVAASLRPLSGVHVRPRRTGLFRPDFEGEGFAGFIDGTHRRCDADYLEARRAYFEQRGRFVFALGTDGRLSPPREGVPSRLQALHARLAALAPLAPDWTPDPRLIPRWRRRRWNSSPPRRSPDRRARQPDEGSARG
jgi:hypothetical protein